MFGTSFRIGHFCFLDAQNRKRDMRMLLLMGAYAEINDLLLRLAKFCVALSGRVHVIAGPIDASLVPQKFQKNLFHLAFAPQRANQVP